ncbi:MAG: SPOR domain-containing protein [Pseudazoarcus pumilus]|nr:SPOR domain-containing protein [Pseudazoarcus pumilus]
MSDNDNLELKKRSRRRLVGAAALALIAAIVLPMVMDGEPVPPVSDIQVTIPERTVDARPIEPREAIAEPVAEAPAELAAPAVVEPLPAAPVQPAPVASPKPEPSAPAPKPLPKPEPAPQPAAPPKPAPAPEAPPKPASAAETAPEESAEARRARAILEGRAVPQEADVQFLVQIGAFSDETKARTRQMDLAAKGFASFVESAGGVSRVRMGPFPSRAEAEAMIVRLRSASFDGVVTTR